MENKTLDAIASYNEAEAREELKTAYENVKIDIIDIENAGKFYKEDLKQVREDMLSDIKSLL